jgi:hypothetical protein
MKYFFFFLFSIFFFSSSLKIENESEIKPFVVLQLFTSQGCSSCPAADKLAEKIREEYVDKNVMILSYHVTYWDRLGWKDPYGKKAYTEMQYAYADKFKEKRVYTPQIVVNGKEHFIGSDEYILRKKLRYYLRKKVENSIQLSTTSMKDTLNIAYKVDGDIDRKSLVFALVLDKETTYVKRGENARKSLTNSNIVIAQKEIPLQKENGEIRITPPTKNKKIRLIAYLQDEKLNISAGTQTKI